MFKFIRYVRECLELLLYRAEALLELAENPPLPGGQQFEAYYLAEQFSHEVTLNFRRKIVTVQGVIGICEGAGSIVNRIFTSEEDKVVLRNYIMLNVNKEVRMIMIDSIEEIEVYG